MRINELRLVSCIITTCRRGRILSRAIESVLNQTYKNIELIVVDDCPCSESEDIVSEYLKDNPGIVYIQNEQNMGPSGARNKGVSVSTGEYIAFLDDDDEWLAEKIEIQVSSIKDAHIICNPPYFRYRVDQSLSEITQDNQHIANVGKSWFLDALFEDFSKFYPSGSLLDKKAFAKVGGFDESLTRGEFWDLLLKMSYGGSLAVSCSEKMVVFDRTERDDRVSQNVDKNDDTFVVLERYKPFVSKLSYRKRKAKLLMKRYKELRQWIDLFSASKLSPSLTMRFVLQNSKLRVKNLINKANWR